MLSSIKNIAFWTLDAVQGGQIRKSYNRIKTIYDLDSTASKLERYHQKSLKLLIEHAIKNTKFYEQYTLKKSISSFPVINKNLIVSQQEDFLSKKYEKKKLIKMSTSGSTGTPFISYQNINKKKSVNAETIFFNGQAGYHVGSKLVYLRSLNLKNKKSKLKQKIENQSLIDIDKLDDDNIKKTLKEIEKFTNKKSATMLSYASTYDILRDYFKKNSFKIADKCQIHGIISTSEILFDETREYMSKAFNCNCYSRYANMENGMLGQDTPKYPNTFIINEANYFIEILKMKVDEPAEQGEVGRIIVTDLYNYAMPMIRYDTGDVGAFTFVEINGIRKKAITEFGGRKIDIITDANGNVVSPHKISVAFWNFTELKQFQFIQETKNKYRVLYCVKDVFNINREQELIEKMQEILGQEAILELESVETIPVLNSGKRKYIINKTL